MTYKLNSLADVLGQMAKLFEPNGSGEQATADGFVNRQLAGVANCIKKLASDGVYGRGEEIPHLIRLRRKSEGGEQRNGRQLLRA